MLARIVPLLAALVLAACGSGEEHGGVTRPEGGGQPAPPAASPEELEAPAPGGTEAGRRVAMQAGCLACHRIGEAGTDGPGSDLTRVGARRSRRALERVLLDPPPPMPSFEALPDRDRQALVDYLFALR
jgi:menaquinol-cytochrome c reductase cytochrome b/c subunit